MMRRVSFPKSDRQLITGYLEPPNPWKNVEMVKNNFELIKLYELSCNKHGGQPLEEVLDQLKAIDLNKPLRQPILSLKSVKLLSGDCEALEEIFKRVQYEFIDLSSCELKENSISAMFDMIEYYEATNELDISSNPDGMTYRGWSSCSEMIGRSRELHVLNAKGNPISKSSVEHMGNALNTSNLHTLKLEHCGLKGKPLDALCNKLIKNRVLKELWLGYNDLDCHDAKNTANLLSVNNYIELIDISNNNIMDDGLWHIVNALVIQSVNLNHRSILQQSDIMKDGRDISTENTLQCINIVKGLNQRTLDFQETFKENTSDTTEPSNSIKIVPVHLGQPMLEKLLSVNEYSSNNASIVSNISKNVSIDSLKDLILNKKTKLFTNNKTSGCLTLLEQLRGTTFKLENKNIDNCDTKILGSNIIYKNDFFSNNSSLTSKEIIVNSDRKKNINRNVYKHNNMVHCGMSESSKYSDAHENESKSKKLAHLMVGNMSDKYILEYLSFLKWFFLKVVHTEADSKIVDKCNDLYRRNSVFDVANECDIIQNIVIKLMYKNVENFIREMTGIPLYTIRTEINSELIRFSDLQLKTTQCSTSNCITPNFTMFNSHSLSSDSVGSDNSIDGYKTNMCRMYMKNGTLTCQQRQKDQYIHENMHSPNGLKVLAVWNNNLTKESGHYISDLLIRTSTLELLNVGKNCLSNDFVSYIKEALIKNKTLKTIGLQSAHLSSKGIEILSSILTFDGNHTLQRIDLRGNKLDDKSLSMLYESLKSNLTITQLDIDDEPKRTLEGHEAHKKYTRLIESIRSKCCSNEHIKTSLKSKLFQNSSKNRQISNSYIWPRKFSLTCQSPLPVDPSIVNTESKSINRLDIKRKTNRLCSPIPSPSNISPSSSPSRNRFHVVRVAEDNQLDPCLKQTINSNISINCDKYCSFTYKETSFTQSNPNSNRSRFHVSKIYEDSHLPLSYQLLPTLTTPNRTEIENSSVNPKQSVTCNKYKDSGNCTNSSLENYIVDYIIPKDFVIFKDKLDSKNKKNSFFTTTDLNKESLRCQLAQKLPWVQNANVDKLLNLFQKPAYIFIRGSSAKLNVLPQISTTKLIQ